MSSDTLQEISRQVTEALPASERRNFDASFAVKWDLFEYWKYNLGERRDLTPVLTVSGSEKNAYAATCGEYLKMCWPDLGLELLQIIERSMTEDHPSCKIYPMAAIDGILTLIPNSGETRTCEAFHC